jgi:coenzyme F420-reducing hydrogenase gamma subunit
LIEGAKVESQKEPKEVNRFVVDIGVCAVRALVDGMIVHE